MHYKGPDGEEGYVHSGMYSSAVNINNSPVREVVAATLKKHPSYSLVLTGHSLGGGCAALLTMLWARKTVDETGKEDFWCDASLGFPRRPIRCFVYV